MKTVVLANKWHNWGTALRKRIYDTNIASENCCCLCVWRI